MPFRTQALVALKPGCELGGARSFETEACSRPSAGEGAHTQRGVTPGEGRVPALGRGSPELPAHRLPQVLQHGHLKRERDEETPLEPFKND